MTEDRRADARFPRDLTETVNLVPAARASATGYAFHRPRGESAAQRADDDDDGFPEISVMTDEQLAREELSKKIAELLKQPAAGACWCEEFEGSMDSGIFTRTKSGRFVVLETGQGERAYAKLTDEQRARGDAELAIGYCPFDRFKFDPSILHTPWNGSDDQPPLCCSWMAHAVHSTEQVELPSPNDHAPQAVFVDEKGSRTAFKYCPRCGVEMRALITRRCIFFRSHRK